MSMHLRFCQEYIIVIFSFRIRVRLNLEWFTQFLNCSTGHKATLLAPLDAPLFSICTHIYMSHRLRLAFNCLSDHSPLLSRNTHGQMVSTRWLRILVATVIFLTMSHSQWKELPANVKGQRLRPSVKGHYLLDTWKRPGLGHRPNLPSRCHWKMDL